ncbi:hypothetical protein [Pseudomonas sp. BBP2017]
MQESLKCLLHLCHGCRQLLLVKLERGCRRIRLAV